MSTSTEVQDDVDINDEVETIVEENNEENSPQNYDVVLHVKPSKLSTIKTEILDGQRCIVIPLSDDEQATINGIEDMI